MTGAAVGRDHAVDALRTVAVAGVVLGHWLVTAPTAPGALDGAVQIDSPLRTMPFLAPVSWLLQTLGLFFLVAGFGAARSRSATDEPGPRWWWRRTVRLLRPVAVLAGAAALVALALGLTGASQSLVRTVVTLALSPLWFLGVYLALSALTPLLVRLDARWGLAATAVPLVLALSVALAAPLAGHGLGVTTVLTPWWVPWQLGIAMARRSLSRGTVLLLLAAGVTGLVLLLTVGGLPPTAVGLPGAARSNLDPPSAATVCLALAQAGLAAAVLPALRRHSGARWLRAAAGAGGSALRVFLVHQPLFVLLWLATLPAGPVVGLHDAPAGPGWLLSRALWLLPLAAALTGVARAHIPRPCTPIS